MTAQVGIRHGNEVWREFRSATGLDSSAVKAVGMFDFHDVIDTMSFDESCDTGVDLDFVEEVVTYLCSFGKEHRTNAFVEGTRYVL